MYFERGEPLPRGRRAAPAGPDARAGADAARHHRGQLGARLSSRQRRRGGQGRRPARRARRRASWHGVDPVRRGRLRVPHRLRERREPAPSARSRPAARDRHARGAGCDAASLDAAAGHGNGAALRAGWRGGRRAGDVAGAAVRRRVGLRKRREDPAYRCRRTGARVHRVRRRPVRRRVRARSRVDPVVGPHVHDALKEGAARSTASGAQQRVRRGLVIGEVALAFVLLAGGGLALRSFLRLASTDPGFDAKTDS